MSKSPPTGRQAIDRWMSRFRLRLRKSWVEAKVEKELKLSLNLNLREVRKTELQP